jgi:hypothetical protein
MTNSKSYFEKVYLGKNNDKVSINENKRLQKLLSARAFNRSGDSVRADLNVFRPAKPNAAGQVDLGLLLERFE